MLGDERGLASWLSALSRDGATNPGSHLLTHKS
jgi:hypothetical protein